MGDTLENQDEHQRLIDPWWRKARIAARLILKREAGQAWSARDRRLAQAMAGDPGVTNRLIAQAMSFTKARQNGFRLMERGS
jgi:hypothetical protein